MNELISVIVPVYKVEEYLDRCVASIVGQSYTNLEIILIDDGSPDACPAMCDAWAERDSRIKVIHKENGGLSDARNAGLAAATGEYIGFVDSDDYIAPSMYGELMSHLTDTGSDIAACGVNMVWEDGKSASLTPEGSHILDNNAAMEAIVKESLLKQPVWYKLYRHATIDGITFEKGKRHEDVFWSYQPIARAKRVCIFDTALYFYRQRTGSIMSEGFSAGRLDALEAMEKRLVFLKDNYPELVDCAQNSIYFFSMYLMQSALRSHAPEKIMSEIEAYAKKHTLSPDSLTDRLWKALAKVSFRGTCRIRNAIGVGR